MRMIVLAVALTSCQVRLGPDPAETDAERVAGGDCTGMSEAVFYTQDTWGVLADALAADASPCVDYWVSMPPYTGHKTDPRAEGEPEEMRARSPQLHAMAEFHWTTWSGVS